MHSFSWLTRFLLANGNFKCMIFKSWPSVNSIRHSLNTLLKDGKMFQQILDILELVWSCFCVCIWICSQWERENSYLVQFWTSKREVGGNLGSKTSQPMETVRDGNRNTKVLNSWAEASPQWMLPAALHLTSTIYFRYVPHFRQTNTATFSIDWPK